MTPKLSRSPNFFVVGAPKCGTTALYDMLRQHPEIYMSPLKEPHFFTFDGDAPVFNGPGGHYYQRYAVQRRLDYLLLFASASEELAIGEVSPSYLFSPFAASRIFKNYPDSRIIVLLRQPADRAYSRYQYNRFHLIEHLNSFQKALELETTRKRMGWLPVFFYKEEGSYYSHLKRYFELFPREQIRVYLYEDFNRAPSVVLADLFRLLGVDESFVPILRRRNVTRVPKVELLHRLAMNSDKYGDDCKRALTPFLSRSLLSAVKLVDDRFNLTVPPPMEPDTRMALTEGYRDEIVKLQDLIGRDLSDWFKAKSSAGPIG